MNKEGLAIVGVERDGQLLGVIDRERLQNFIEMYSPSKRSFGLF